MITYSGATIPPQLPPAPAHARGKLILARLDHIESSLRLDSPNEEVDLATVFRG